MSVPIMDEDGYDTPFIVMLRHPNRIVYENLEGGLGCMTYCELHL